MNPYCLRSYEGKTTHTDKMGTKIPQTVMVIRFYLKYLFLQICNVCLEYIEKNPKALLPYVYFLIDSFHEKGESDGYIGTMCLTVLD